MGWPSFRLDQVAEVAAGNPAPQEPSDFADDGSLFIRMQDVGRWHHTSNLTDSTDRVSADAISKHRLRLFTAGSVLIPKSGASVNLNHRAMLGCDAYVVSHLAIIVPDRRKLLPEYLYLWSLSYDPRSQAQTTSLPSLPLSLIKAATIQVPPLPDQRRVVDLLSRAEGIVRLRREAEKKAAELIPALFLDMFGDPATNPKAWPVVNFASFGECRLGKMLDKKKQTSEFQRPYLRNVNVQWDRVDTYDLLTMDINPKEQATLLLREGDVLICEGGEIGRAAVWHGQIEECYYQKALHKLDPDLTKVRPDFVVWLLWHLAQSGALLGSSTHATIAHLTGVQLKNLKVIAPPVEIQIEFERLVEQAHSIQSQQSAATAKAQATFDALMEQNLLVQNNPSL